MNQRSSYNSCIASIPQLGKLNSTNHIVMPGESLYNSKPIHNSRRISNKQSFHRKSAPSMFVRPSKSSNKPILIEKKNCRDEIDRSIKLGSTLLPGLHPPQIEAQILIKMKLIAMTKSEQGSFTESQLILKKVLECQLETLGPYHSQVANTFYQLGYVLNKLGNSDAALIEFEKALKILFPSRHRDPNMDLSKIFHEISIIYGGRKDYQSALYYLDLAKQVEIHILGRGLDQTLHRIREYSKKKQVGRRRMSI